jgi:tetratricopeptide (TPR) repeat protein
MDHPHDSPRTCLLTRCAPTVACVGRPGRAALWRYGLVVALGLLATRAGRAQSEPASMVVGPDTQTAAVLRQRGLEFGNNLDYPEAFAAFKAAEAADPDDPTAYRLAAATIWMRLLFNQGAVTVDDYLGVARSTLSRVPPDPSLADAFHDELQRALTLAERRVEAHPTAADAHYQLGAVYGVLASYTATVEGHALSSLGPGRRAYHEHERALDLDSSRLDAGLIIGLYRCVVADLPLPTRWLAHVAGFDGDRNRGMHLVEGAAQYPGDFQANAAFMLILLYSRAHRFEDESRVIVALEHRYPRNRLLWLEEGRAALSAGHPDAARAALEAGLVRVTTETRPLATAEISRWRLLHGAALVALNQPGAAEAELGAALADARWDWLRGRIRLELGKVASLDGDRARAREEFRAADRLCRADHDAECVAGAAALFKASRP